MKIKLLHNSWRCNDSLSKSTYFLNFPLHGLGSENVFGCPKWSSFASAVKDFLLIGIEGIWGFVVYASFTRIVPTGVVAAATSLVFTSSPSKFKLGSPTLYLKWEMHISEMKWTCTSEIKWTTKAHTLITFKSWQKRHHILYWALHVYILIIVIATC